MKMRLFLVVVACVSAGLLIFSYSRPLATAVEIPNIALADLHPLIQTEINKTISAVEQNPASDQAWGQLGMALISHNFQSEALTCFRQAMLLNPDDFRWPYFAGYAVASTDYAQAKTYFEQALQLKADYAPVRLRYASILIRQGKLDSAIEVLDEGLVREPNNPYLLVTRGRISLMQNKSEAAKGYFAQAVAQPNWMPRSAYLELVKIARREHDLDATLQYERELDRLPKISQLEYPDPMLEEIREYEGLLRSDVERADAAMATGDFSTAIRIYEDLVKKRPEFQRARVILANAYARSGQSFEALREFQNVLDSDPNNILAMISLAGTYDRLGLYSESIRYYRQTLELKPDHRDVWIQLGTVYQKIRQPEQGLACFQRACQIDPSDPQAHLALGVSLMEQERFDDAIKPIRRSVELAPGDSTSKAYLKLAEEKLEQNESKK